MRLSHSTSRLSATFDEPTLVSCAGLVPAVRLADLVGLRREVDDRLSVPSDRGAHAGDKVTALVAGMIAGADSIDDMAVLRHAGMGRVFDRRYAPSTLGAFLRAFTFGHVRQLDAAAARVLAGVTGRAPVLPGLGELDGLTCVDVDDSIIEVHGHAKQGAGFGYSGVRGLNMLLATVSTAGSVDAAQSRPVIVAQRLRKGAVGSSRGSHKLIGDALATVRRLSAGAGSGAGAVGPAGLVLLRADSAFYGARSVTAALRGGAQVSVTVRRTAPVDAAIAAIPEQAWTTIRYPHPVLDPDTGQLIDTAQVAETPFTAFTSKPAAERVTGRLVVRRVPDANHRITIRQGQLFATWRHHAFLTTTDPAVIDTVTADRLHRAHAVIEQVNADLKASAVAHLPSGVFAANAAWLVCAVLAYNLTRAAGCLAGGPLTRATTATLRRTLITVPARVVRHARDLTLRLPTGWPWQSGFTRLFTAAFGPPTPATT